MNLPLANLKKIAIELNILPFHEIKSRSKKGKMIHFKAKTKQELINNINKKNPKLRKRLRKVQFCNTTINNTGNTKQLVTNRTGKGPRTVKNRTTTTKIKCNEIQIKQDCKFTRKGNQPAYTRSCLEHFPCYHKKGFAELQNANNFKHYLQTTQNGNYKHNKNTLSKRESRHNYGYIPAKNAVLVRSSKFKENLALWQTNTVSKQKQLKILENGNILKVKRNSNGVLRINKY